MFVYRTLIWRRYHLILVGNLGSLYITFRFVLLHCDYIVTSVFKVRSVQQATLRYMHVVQFCHQLPIGQLVKGGS